MLHHTKRNKSLRFAIGVLSNATGNGIFFAFSIVMLQESTGLSLAIVGVAVTVSALAILPFVPYAGRLMDRFGAGRVLIVACVIRAVCFLLFTWSINLVLLIVFLAVASIASKAEQAGAPTIAGRMGDGPLARWIARLRVMTNIGMGAGSLLAGVWISVASDSLALLPLVCAAFFLIGGLGYATLGNTRSADTRDEEQRRSSWRSRSFMIAASLNAVLLLVAGAAESAIAIDFLKLMALPAWYVSFFFIANTIILIALQIPLSGWIERRATSTNILVGSALYASSFAVLLLTRATSIPFLMIAIAVLLLTVGEVILIQAMLVLLMGLAPEAQRAEFMATDQVLAGIALGLAPMLAAVALPAAPLLFWGVLGVATIAIGLIAGLALQKHMNAVSMTAR